MRERGAWRLAIAACAIAISVGLPAYATEGESGVAGESPWEPFDPPPEQASPQWEAYDGDVVRDVLHAVIGHYREHIGPRSIRRCPFTVSCSAYANGLIHRYGIAGLLGFLDRFLYREHPFAFELYPWHVDEDGTMRLEDHALR